MNIISRRNFFKSLGLGTAGLSLGSGLFSLPFLRRELVAAPSSQFKKLIFIFQRGGSDGINTVIPRGDLDYSTANRPTLFIPEATALNSGNGFAQFHPRLQPMMEIYNKLSLNGLEGAGNLAAIHRVGYADQSRSHFDSQQYWENGVPGDAHLEEGFLYRFIERTIDRNREENSFIGAALSGSPMVALRGANPLPNFSDSTQFTFVGNPQQSLKFLGRLPSDGDALDGKGLLGLYGSNPDVAGKIYRDLVHQTGRLLGSTMNTLQQAIQQGPYVPENGASYPAGSFGDKLKEAAMLFKRTSSRFIGLNIGGWDTHTRQGQANGRQGDLLEDLAMGFQALYRDLQDQWNDVLIVTMTEFGRTSKENASLGTDHAEACVMFVAGGSVRGGVYNCDNTHWQRGDMFSVRDRYLARKTDFRSVFAEIFLKYFQDSPALLDEVLPGFSQAKASNPSDFQSLNFLNT